MKFLKKVACLVLVFALAGCDADKETNATSMTAKDSVWADVGQGKVTLTLDSLTLADTVTPKLFTLEQGMAKMSVASVSRDSDTSVSLSLKGAIDASAPFSRIILSYQGVKNGKENYATVFTTSKSLYYVHSFRTSTSSSSDGTTTTKKTTYDIGIALHNGAKFIASAITDTTVSYSTSDEKNAPLSDLTASYHYDEAANEVSLSFTGDSTKNLMNYKVSFAASVNDLGVAYQVSLGDMSSSSSTGV